MKGLTKRQREIVDFIRDYIAVHHYSPSYREIMKHFDFTSLGSVYKHIAVLKRKGVLSAEKASARSVTLSREEQEATNGHSLELPLMGYIVANQPLDIAPQGSQVTVPAKMVRDPANAFVLEAACDSLKESGIWQGDHIILEKSALAATGDTVVTVVDGRATLSTYEVKGNEVCLTRPVSQGPTVQLPLNDVKIQGILRGLMRRYR